MQSKATTVAAYLAELPADRRRAIEAVLVVIRANIDPDYEEGMQYGMIGYYVPHRLYPAGYHCDPQQPLPFASVASQKNHMAVYLMCEYMHGEDSAFRRAWAKTGKKLDMGKSCIRFKKVEDLALDVIGEAIKRTPVKKHLAFYENALKTMRTDKPKAAGKVKKAKTAKKAARK